MSFIINLFGEGARYWICTIPIAQFNEFKHIKESKYVSWETLLFDLDFLAHFGYNHWSELSVEPEIKGFYLVSKNKIEIKKRNRIIMKISALEILNKGSLFDLFSIEEITLNFEHKENYQSILLSQTETGLFAKYELNKSSFNIDHLLFSISDLQNHEASHMLVNLSYENKSLRLKSEDTLIRSFKVSIL